MQEFGVEATSFGLGAATDAEVRDIVAVALRKARELVAGIREYMAVYRNPESWLRTFSVFRLPSPLSAPAGSARAKEAQAQLNRIRDAGGLGEQAIKELRQILPRAEWHAQAGCATKAAWGRASAEFPELQAGRSLITCFLTCRTSTGNRERVFGVLREQKTSRRAAMLETTLEDLLQAEMGPPAASLRAAQQPSGSDGQAVAATPPPSGSDGKTAAAMPAYLVRLARWHAMRHGEEKRQRTTPGSRKRRRDAGVERSTEAKALRQGVGGTRCSDAAFATKRAAAIEATIQAGPQELAQMRTRSAFGAVAEAASAERVAASATTQERARKRAQEAGQAHREAPKRAAAARAKFRAKVVRAFVGTNGPQDDSRSAPPGVALVRVRDQQALARLRQQCFRVSHDPVDFVKLVLDCRARAPKRGHVVLAPPMAVSDYTMAARLVASLLGTYQADPTAYLTKGSACSRPSVSTRRPLGSRMCPDQLF